MTNKPNNTAAKGRPSDLRRQTLMKEMLDTPSLSSFFPITRYYDLAQKLYRNVWKTVHGTQDLDTMYVYAKRYCMFIVDVIPTHPYYGAPVNRELQNKHTQQVQKCISLLETIADRMDEECLAQQRMAELELERRKQAEARRKQEEAQRQQEAAQQAQQQIDAWVLSQQQQQQKTTTSKSSTNVQQSALDKLKLLQQGGAEIAMGVPVLPPPQQQQQQPTRKRSSTRYGLIDDSDTDDDYAALPSSQYGMPLPPPMLPPTSEETTTPQEEDKKEDDSPAVPPPPPYQAVISHNKYHSFFGPTDDDDDAATIPTQPQFQPTPKKQPQVKQPMRQQQALYRNLYAECQRKGRIQVLSLGTYQGRVSSSTNGCTVISALVAARHLNSSSTSPISDQTVMNVIDQQCGPFLREIRRKLGLSGAALIIPSDVHDHLVDAGILRQDYFAGAAGGNIMDPSHSGEFLKLLTDTTKRKAAATLFFREHVISIVKFPANNNNGSSSSAFNYDLIDSLPSSSTGRATRTRCVDADSLQILLQWYASRKFSDHHCDYIDKSAWDDSCADVDPRVFQGFVWSSN